MIIQSEFNLFNAADNTLMPYLSQDDFDKSLLFNVLFQDKLLVHESNFFTSFFLANHIKRSKSHISLFEAAAMEGFVIPAFRDNNINTLRESYSSMREIYGKDYMLTNEAHDIDCLHRMCNSVDLGRQKTDAYYWPKNIILGVGYHETLKTFLQRDELPSYIIENEHRHSLVSKYWDATKSWRYDLIELAAHNTQKKGSLGLQRTELIKLVAAANGISDSVALDATNPISNYLSDYNAKKIVDVFLKWITQCHHLNMARAFDSSLNFPVYSTNEDFMCESIARVPTDGLIEKSEGFDALVSLPPMNILLAEDPANLLSIRKELGYSYLISLRNWQENPNEKNMLEVKDLFHEYCKRICERYAHNNSTTVKSHYSSSKEIRKEGFDLISNVLSALEPIFGIFMAFSKFGFALYKIVSGEGKIKFVENNLEINLKETSKQYNLTI